MIPVTLENVAEVTEKLKAGLIPGAAKSLPEAMARVMEQVGYVQKTGTINIGGSYKFAGEASFIAAVRPELVKQQIVVAPVDMQPLFMDVFAGKSGPQNRVVLRVTWRFTHAPTGQTLDVVTCGEGIDSGDKATNKAMTGAMKYALRQAFVIETGNDPDETPSHTQERAQPKPEPAKAPAPAVTQKPAAQPAAFKAADLTPWAQTIIGKLRAALTRDTGGPLYQEFDAKVKDKTIAPADKAALDQEFSEFTRRFPKTTAAKP